MRIIFFIASLLLFSNVNAQTTSVPTEQVENAIDAKDVYAFTSKDESIQFAFKHNGKLQGYLSMECQNFEKKGNKFESTIHCVALNKKEKKSKSAALSGMDYLISINEIEADGSYYLAQDYILGYAGENRSGYLLKIPANLKVGDKIEGGTLEFTVKFPMSPACHNKVTANDFVVTAEEDVVTPAGTFKCLKIEGTMTGSYQKLKLNDKQTWYIAKGYGIIKEESHYYGTILIEPYKANIKK